MQDYYIEGTWSRCRYCLQPIGFALDRWFGFDSGHEYCWWAEQVSDWHWHQPVPSVATFTIDDVAAAVYCNNAVNSDKDWAVLDETICRFVVAQCHQIQIDTIKLFQV